MTDEEKAAAEAAQEEAAAALAANDKTATEDEETAEETVEKPEAKTVSSDDKLANVLEKLAERLTPQMTEAQKEEQLKKLEEETGFSPKQLRTLSKIKEDATVSAALLHGEELGKTKAENILGKLAPKLKAKVEEAMSTLAPSVRSNPKAWEEMAYLVKGKNIDFVTADDAEGGNTGNGSKVGGGMKGLTGVKKGSSGDNGNRGSGKQYDADERTIIDRYFAGDTAAYEVSKGEKRVGQPRKGDEQKPSGVADRELARLTGGQIG